MKPFMSLIVLLFIPFAGSLLAGLLPTYARNWASSWAALVTTAVALPMALLYPQVRAGGVVTERLAWLPSLGLDVIVRVDGFAWLFAMLISGMGLLVIVESQRHGHEPMIPPWYQSVRWIARRESPRGSPRRRGR